jgi:stage II sporulation protein E
MLSVEARSKAGEARMRALSDAFDSLSKRFYSLSDRLKRPRLLDLRNICDESFTRRCAGCRNRDLCWGAEYDRTLETQARLAAQLHGGGRADAADLPDSLRDFCPHMEELVEDINGRCARLTENLLRSEQTDVFAADYAAMAALLADALEEERQEAQHFTCNRESADAIYEYLGGLGVTVQGVVVMGKQSRRRRIIVRGKHLDGLAPRTEEVQTALEGIVGVKLTPPLFEREESGDTMTLCSAPVLSTEYAGSTLPAGFGRNEPLPPPLTHDTPDGTYAPPAVCGDHIALFKTDNAYLYALISDGMGAGEEASLTSDICAMFLEKMLAAGNKVDISLKMLDTYVRSKNRGTGEECSATVDLMELDLMDGQAVFAKNGAAPTYVVREGQVYKLHAPTMPIGILSDLPSQQLRFRTHPGDVVVMVSDGVTQGNDECPWLIDLLSSPGLGSMDSLRADIIRRALAAGSEDDLSAIAIRVAE